MRIFTSSWFTTLPPEIARIGISRGVPRGQSGYRRYTPLNPGPWFNSVSPRDYKRLYFELLDGLNPRTVVRSLETISEGRDCALLCYEAPRKMADWCHRGFVSAWLFDKLGIEVFEFGMEEYGCGWHHPKLPPQYRAHDAKPEPLDVSPYIGAEAESAGVVWRVVGFDPENPDQALIESNGQRRSISGDVLRSRFRPVL